VEARYRTASSWLKGIVGGPVRKITIDAGLGCPNRDGRYGSTGCIYCNARGSGTGALTQGYTIAEQVDRGVEVLARRYKCEKFIAYFQSFTNTYAPAEKLAAIYREATLRPEIKGLAVGTRPDCVPDEVLDLLAEHAKQRLVWIEYGLQSIHEKTLRLIQRGHGPDAFFDAVERTRARNIHVVAHTILGLPGESLSDMVQTARALAKAGVNGVKIHPLYVIRNTALEGMFLDGSYRSMTEDEAIDAVLAVMEALPEDIVIHRFTSDPHPEELVAPLWMLDKRGVRERLKKAMQERDFHQGKGVSPV
jgi:uncharacterized protein